MRILLAALVALFIGAKPAEAAAPPVTAFARLPAITDAVISPNGQQVATVAGTTQGWVVSIATLDQPEVRTVRLPDATWVNLLWAGDHLLLAEVSVWQRVGGQAYEFDRTIALAPDGRVVSQLLQHDIPASWMITQPILRITDEDDPKAMILGVQGTESSGNGRAARQARKRSNSLVVWRVDPATGRGTIVERGVPETVTWELNRTGEPRLRLDRTPDKHLAVLVRHKVDPSWRPFWRTKAKQDAFFTFSESEDAIYVREGDRFLRLPLGGGAPTLIRTFEPGETPTVHWDGTGTPIAISQERERSILEWLDADLGSLHASLHQSFPDRDVVFTDWSKDRSRLLLRLCSPDTPDEWFIYDRQRKELSPVATEYPELKGAALGRTRWLEYRARDGLVIPAYLTLPLGGDPDRKPPLIVLPHGGPARRDLYEFDYMTQFLASRGYAVLRPQYRGSEGLGDTLNAAGEGEWAEKVQTDLRDGIAAVAANGAVDANKVCIVGSGFGGYGALLGATKHAQAYRCAVSIGGVSDLGLYAKQPKQVFSGESSAMTEWRREIAKASPDKRAESSPLRRVAEAGIPILLIHGEHDTLVGPEQSRRMAAALTKAGKTNEIILLKGGDQYLSSYSARLGALEALERFLAKNLPVS